MPRKITTLVIDRDLWGTSHLLNYDCSMCCLGFLAIKCGAVPSEIFDETYPESTPNIDWPAELIKVGSNKNIKNSALTLRMTEINDHRHMSLDEKEQRLISLFKKIGIKLSFKGSKKVD